MTDIIVSHYAESRDAIENGQSHLWFLGGGEENVRLQDRFGRLQKALSVDLNH
jgi:hypothetical protein